MCDCERHFGDFVRKKNISNNTKRRAVSLRHLSSNVVKELTFENKDTDLWSEDKGEDFP